MIITRGMLSRTSGEIRSAEAALAGVIGELRDAGVWSGDDADRFMRDWNDQVRGRLLGAANLIDGVTLITRN